MLRVLGVITIVCVGQCIANEWREVNVEGSDEALLALIAIGDETALGALYARYAGAVFSLALRLVRDPETAEDLTQEVFLKIWLHAADYRRERGSASGWILGTTHHAGVDELRRRATRPRPIRCRPDSLVSLTDVTDNSPGPHDLLLVRMRRELLVDAIGRLPWSQRECIELAYFGGLTQVEIAVRSAAPVGTIKTRCKLALRKLRGHLEAQGVRPGTH